MSGRMRGTCRRVPTPGAAGRARVRPRMAGIPTAGQGSRGCNSHRRDSGMTSRGVLQSRGRVRRSTGAPVAMLVPVTALGAAIVPGATTMPGETAAITATALGMLPMATMVPAATTTPQPTMMASMLASTATTLAPDTRQMNPCIDMASRACSTGWGRRFAPSRFRRTSRSYACWRSS